MQRDLQFRRNNRGTLHVENPADRHGESADPHTAIEEMRTASRDAILRACRNPANSVVKVRSLEPHKAEAGGYVTLGRYLVGATPAQLEAKLGLAPGAYGGGCRIYQLDGSAITADNIGARYMTSWSAGVSPRDLAVLSDRAGEDVGYHPDYPPASDPVPQFVLFRPVPTLRSVVLNAGSTFAEPPWT